MIKVIDRIMYKDGINLKVQRLECCVVCGLVKLVRNVMAHAQKQDFVFP